MTGFTRVVLLTMLIGGPVFSALLLYSNSIGSRFLHYAAYFAFPIGTVIAIKFDEWITKRRGEVNEPARPSDWHG